MRQGSMEATGVPEEKEIQSFWEAQTFTLREWRKMLRVWSGHKARSIRSGRGASG